MDKRAPTRVISLAYFAGALAVLLLAFNGATSAALAAAAVLLSRRGD